MDDALRAGPAAAVRFAVPRTPAEQIALDAEIEARVGGPWSVPSERLARLNRNKGRGTGKQAAGGLGWWDD